MGILRNLISKITVHQEEKESFIENEVKQMGKGE